jgi:GTP cyclohydrolase I
MSSTKATDPTAPPARPERTEHTHPELAADGSAPIARYVQEILGALGEDTGREGLLKTPERVEKSLRWLTQGYAQSVREAVGDAIFEESHQSMIMVRDIELYSLCEHHMLPFFGRAHVAYIPDGKIMGLSKAARIVDVFARRLQVQERLTDQIADAVMDVLTPHGVGVVVEAAHFCMMMRGVEKQNSRTVTSALRGIFRDDSKTRDEFLRLAHNHRD